MAGLIAPLLVDGAKLIAFADKGAPHPEVRDAVPSRIVAARDDADLHLVESKDFHGRFWIADRRLGVIMGTSQYQIGHKIFFTDKLTDSDVAAVLEKNCRPGSPSREARIVAGALRTQ